MAVEILTDSTGRRWTIDWPVARSVVRSYLYWSLLDNLGEMTDRETWMEWLSNPGNWNDWIVGHQIPWDTIHRERDYYTKILLARLHEQADRDPKFVRETLASYARQAAVKERLLFDRLPGEETKELLKDVKYASDLVRDTSITLLLAHSGTRTVAQLSALAIGGSLEFTANYTDTGHVGEAVAQTSATVTFKIVKIDNENIMIAVEAIKEAGLSLISGESVSEAIKKGGLTAVSEKLAEILSPKIAKDILKTTGLPGRINISHSSYDRMIGRDVKTVEFVEDLVTTTIKRSPGSSFSFPYVSLEKASENERMKCRRHLSAGKQSERECFGSDEMMTDLKVVEAAIRPISSPLR